MGTQLVGSFLGLIDEVRVWNRALSQTEIQTSMSRRLTGQEVGLVGYWDFDADTANDKSAFGNHGTLVGQAKTVGGFLVGGFTLPPLVGKPLLLSGRFSFIQGYRLTLDGEPNASYQLETSTNLLQWTPLITVKTTSNPLVFTDPSATNFPNFRFYRATRVP